MVGCGVGERKLTNMAQTEPGEALAFALVLVMISASICVTCEGLQGGVMEVYLERSSQFKIKKKKEERNSDHCGLEIGICVAKF